MVCNLQLSTIKYHHFNKNTNICTKILTFGFVGCMFAEIFKNKNYGIRRIL